MLSVSVCLCVPPPPRSTHLYILFARCIHRAIPRTPIPYHPVSTSTSNNSSGLPRPALRDVTPDAMCGAPHTWAIARAQAALRRGYWLCWGDMGAVSCEVARDVGGRRVSVG
jgi:hypothetical protein